MLEQKLNSEPKDETLDSSSPNSTKPNVVGSQCLGTSIESVTPEKQSAEVSLHVSGNGVLGYPYKQIETSPQIIMSGSKSIMHPVATLSDEAGGVCQIINDDHCYVLCLCQEDGTYKDTTHIFKEAFNVLKQLPQPD